MEFTCDIMCLPEVNSLIIIKLIDLSRLYTRYIDSTVLVVDSYHIDAILAVGSD